MIALDEIEINRGPVGIVIPLQVPHFDGLVKVNHLDLVVAAYETDPKPTQIISHRGPLGQVVCAGPIVSERYRLSNTACQYAQLSDGFVSEIS